MGLSQLEKEELRWNFWPTTLKELKDKLYPIARAFKRYDFSPYQREYIVIINEKFNFIYGYNRYNVRFWDEDEFCFEIQIGTVRQADFYEITGITIPKELKLSRELKGDLHDIGYKLFFGIAAILEESTDKEEIKF